MIKVSFEAATPAALNTLIGQYLVAAGIAAAAPVAPEAKPAKVEKPPKAEVAAPAPAAAPPAAEPPAASAPAPTAVTYDMIFAQVPKTAALGANAKVKLNALMAKWGVDPGKGKKVKDVVPAEKYAEFFAELTAIDNG